MNTDFNIAHPAVHTVKALAPYFQSVLDGVKRFEIRINDRDYRVGDVVLLQEYDGRNYSGRAVYAAIRYFFGVPAKNEHQAFGLTPGYCVLSIEKLPSWITHDDLALEFAGVDMNNKRLKISDTNIIEVIIAFNDVFSVLQHVRRMVSFGGDKAIADMYKFMQRHADLYEKTKFLGGSDEPYQDN